MRCPILSELPAPPHGKSGWPWTEETQQLPDTILDGSPWPQVSIVTPSYNQAQFLEETIRSVLLQGYPDLEYFVMDGGSTDGSVQIIQKYAPWLTGWVSEQDKGQSDAINKGFHHAQGQIIAWLNSDDLYLPGCVSSSVKFLFTHPKVMVAYGDVDVIDTQGHLLWRQKWDEYDFKKHLTHRIRIPQPAAFFRHDVLDKIGYLIPNLHYAMDYEFWLRIGRYFPIRRIGKIMAQFRLSPINKSTTQTNKWGAEFIKILDDFYSEPDLPMEIVKIKRQAYAGAYLRSASNALVMYDMDNVRGELARAMLVYKPIMFRYNWWIVAIRYLLGIRLNKAALLIRAQLRYFFMRN